MVRTKYKSGIYIILNKINGKAYVGSAANLEARLYYHKNTLQKRIHVNIYLQRAWDKYGEENFEFRIVLYCNNKERLLREQELIDEYISKNIAYNIYPTAGSPLGSIHSKDTKEKMSNTRKEYWKTVEHLFGTDNPFYGKQHTKITKEKISKSNKGKLIGNQHVLGNKFNLTEEQKDKIKDAWTPEMREAQSKRLKGKIAWNKGLKGVGRNQYSKPKQR